MLLDTLRFLRSVFNDEDADVRRKTIALYGLLIAANIGAWLWALTAFRDYPMLLASAVLAYTLGLRHAVDADHIAAIDNVTRKLMQEGKRPVAVGFFFSLGHSAVVTLMSIGIALAAAALQSRFAEMKSVGSMISTSMSALFLFLLAFFNLLILLSVWRAFRAVKRGETLRAQDLDLLLSEHGVMARLFRPLFRLASRSWHLFPMGFLFGLGFDTATEVALFGISAAEAARGVPFWTIMVFPALFTAGMSLVDTTDGVLMLGAYGWAFTKPIRKLYYNMTITLVSVVVAVVIGGIESLGLIADKLGLEGGLWDVIGALNDHFGMLGYVIIGVFVVSWLVSLAVYRLRGYDKIEVRLG
ncbi:MULTISPECIES: HoxN/HupN/NixA family nickel/cobalt transporter [unclassified Cupriavidus]|uniref:HoxN/HupN/NixA family nickel/cobalt transporter n=1 Tax=unclassified Cupriavidus TaxID=2640874 RepID=UPI000B881FEF|nr:HoxN/HupN/NixA family nickel/cobalt transporter [Cupriavidus sp. YR651]